MAFQSYMHQKAHRGKNKYNDFIVCLHLFLGVDCLASTACRFYRGLLPLWGRNLPCKITFLQMIFNSIKQDCFSRSSIFHYPLTGITTFFNEPTSIHMKLL